MLASPLNNGTNTIVGARAGVADVLTRVVASGNTTKAKGVIADLIKNHIDDILTDSTKVEKLKTIDYFDKEQSKNPFADVAKAVKDILNDYQDKNDKALEP